MYSLYASLLGLLGLAMAASAANVVRLKQDCPHCKLTVRIEKSDKPGKVANTLTCARNIASAMVIPNGGFWDYVGGESINMTGATESEGAGLSAVVKFEGIQFEADKGAQGLMLSNVPCDVLGGSADLDCGTCETGTVKPL